MMERNGSGVVLRLQLWETGAAGEERGTKGLKGELGLSLVHS